MAQLILALLTPRAGEWNHHYIIPQGKTWNDTQLGTALQKLEHSHGKMGILYSVTVRQQNGRTGSEKLFLYCPEFDKLPTDIRQKCELCMENWFQDQRERLILNTNWHSEGRMQVTPRSELNNLYQNLEELIPTLPPPQKSHWWLRCAVIIVVLAFGFGLFQGFQWSKGLLGSAEGAPEKPESEDPVDEFLNENRELVEQPGKMFNWTDEKPYSPENLKEALKQIWSGENAAPSEWNEQSPQSVEEFLTSKNPRHDKIAKLCEEIRNKSTFPVFGPNADNEEWEVLEGISPTTFHDCMRIFSSVDTIWTDEWENTVEANFYWAPTDIEGAKVLREWVLKKAYPEDEGHDKEMKNEHSDDSLRDLLKFVRGDQSSRPLEQTAKGEFNQDAENFLKLLEEISAEEKETMDK